MVGLLVGRLLLPRPLLPAALLPAALLPAALLPPADPAAQISFEFEGAIGSPERQSAALSLSQFIE